MAARPCFVLMLFFLTRVNGSIYRNTWEYCFEKGNFTHYTADFDRMSAFARVHRWLRIQTPFEQFMEEEFSMQRIRNIAKFLQFKARFVDDPIAYDSRLRLLPTSKFPKMIHTGLVNKEKFHSPQALSLLSWAKMNPGYTILVYDDFDQEHFIKVHEPSVLKPYQALESNVERSDVWRYVVLCTHGGVYADSDTVCARPVRDWIQPGPGLLYVGIENAFPSLEAANKHTYARQVQMVQWTALASPGHPVLCNMAMNITEKVWREKMGVEKLREDDDHDGKILLRTGPGIWTDAITSYFQIFNTSLTDVIDGGVVGSVQVLPQDAFGCHVKFLSPYNQDSLVYHMYVNSWKVNKTGRLIVAQKEYRHIIYIFLIFLGVFSYLFQSQWLQVWRAIVRRARR